MHKANAYFTVEAALVMPFVMGVVLLTIYLLFFQYDRCLMEQSAGVIALRGCTLQITDRERLVRQLLEDSRKEDKAYIAWRMEDAKISMIGNKVRVERSGALNFPFQGVLSWDGNDVWESEAAFENRRIRPVNFIRNCRKIMGGK